MSAGPASTAARAATGGSAAAVPRHIAIIMDGNGRWAKARPSPGRGHRQGASCAPGAARGGRGRVRPHPLSFSSENWRRPEEEVNDLMGLLRSTSKT